MRCIPRRDLITGLLLAISYFGPTSTAQAQITNTCLAANGGLNCTANDVRVTGATLTNVIDGCVTTDDFAIVDLIASIESGAPTRYDIGLWFAQDTANASAKDGAVCLHDWLNPFGQTHDPDVCLDTGNSEIINKPYLSISIPCADLDADGLVEWSACTSWKNNAGGVCTQISETLPQTASKCNCETADTVITAPLVTLGKTCVPETARPGETISCEINYANTSPYPAGVADFIKFVDDYPSQGTISNVVISSSQGTDTVTDSGGILTITPNALQAPANFIAGASGTVTYDYTIASTVPDGETIMNTVCTYYKELNQDLCDTHPTNITTTAAMIVAHQMSRAASGVRLEWQVGAEAGTAGFHVERWDADTRRYVRVTEHPIGAGLGDGDRYSFNDPAGSMANRYRLVELEFNGRLHPVAIFRAEPANKDNLARVASIRSGVKAAGKSSGSHPDRQWRIRQPKLPVALSAGALSRPQRAKFQRMTRLRVDLEETGLQFVSRAQIARALSANERQIAQDLLRARFELRADGQAHDWWTDEHGSGAYFYGQVTKTAYDRSGVYYFERGKGTSARRFSAVVPAQPVGAAASWYRVREERDLLGLVSAPQVMPTDLYFWDAIPRGQARGFDVTIAGLSPTAHTAEIEVELLAPQEGIAHAVNVSLGGQPIGRVAWTSHERHTGRLAVPSRLLQDGANTFEITVASDSIGVWVDAVSVRYKRTFATDGDHHVLDAGGAAAVVVGPFSSAQIIAVDITDPRRPIVVEQVRATPSGSAVTASFVATDPAATFVVTTASAVRRPTRVERAPRPDVAARLVGIDYVVVAHPSLIAGAQRLAAFRTASGLKSTVVTTDEIYDLFNHGRSSPDAVRALARVAVKEGARYMALVGTASYDYRDVDGLGGNIVPTALAPTPWGMVSSDVRLVDTDGDLRPNLAVGRIPATSPATLTAYLDKLERFEAGPRRRRLVSVADLPDGAGDFDAAGHTTMPSAPAWTHAHLSMVGQSAQDLGDELVRELRAGADIVTYFGHGGLQTIGSTPFFGVQSNAATTTEPVVLLGMTCNMGRFELSRYVSLAQSLVMEPGGAVAVWSPSGQSTHHLASELAASVLDQIITKKARLGTAVRAALGTARTGDNQDVLAGFNLLGDPAIWIGSSAALTGPIRPAVLRRR